METSLSMSELSWVALAVAERAKKVIAIEPDPRIYAILKRNVKGLRNVVTVNKALWNRNCVMRWNFSSEPTSSSLLKTEEQDLNVSVMVEAVRLDSLMSDFNIEEIDFLKIDAEGAEPEVLMGMEDVRRIKKSRGRLHPRTVWRNYNIRSQEYFRIGRIQRFSWLKESARGCGLCLETHLWITFTSRARRKN